MRASLTTAFREFTSLLARAHSRFPSVPFSCPPALLGVSFRAVLLWRHLFLFSRCCARASQFDSRARSTASEQRARTADHAQAQPWHPCHSLRLCMLPSLGLCLPSLSAIMFVCGVSLPRPVQCVWGGMTATARCKRVCVCVAAVYPAMVRQIRRAKIQRRNVSQAAGLRIGFRAECRARSPAHYFGLALGWSTALAVMGKQWRIFVCRCSSAATEHERSSRRCLWKEVPPVFSSCGGCRAALQGGRSCVRRAGPDSCCEIAISWALT